VSDASDRVSASYNSREAAAPIASDHRSPGLIAAFTHPRKIRHETIQIRKVASSSLRVQPIGVNGPPSS
jgi:hypothetical protein